MIRRIRRSYHWLPKRRGAAAAVGLRAAAETSGEAGRGAAAVGVTAGANNFRPLADRQNFGKISAKFARFRLYQHRSLQENTRFAAFFKIYQII